MKDNPIETLCREGLSLLKAQATLFSLESQLAKQSIVPLLASMGTALLLALSLWLTSLVGIGYVVYIYTHHVSYSVLATIIVQLLLLGYALYGIKQYQSHLQFKETRAQLKHYWDNHHE